VDLIQRLFDYAQIDFKPQHRPPRTPAALIATLIALVGSLIADAILVVLGKAIFPSTKGYEHFNFSSYSKLTIIGVIIAGIGWPIVARVCAAPRWLYFRLAIVVTAVLLLPDLYLLVKGDSPAAVFILVLMHFAIAAVTYNTMVRLSPVRHRRRRRGHQPEEI
jgi:hypothetical protein